MGNVVHGAANPHLDCFFTNPSEYAHLGKVDVSTPGGVLPPALRGSPISKGFTNRTSFVARGIDAPIGQVLVCGGGWRWWWSVMTRW